MPETPAERAFREEKQRAAAAREAAVAAEQSAQVARQHAQELEILALISEVRRKLEANGWRGAFGLKKRQTTWLLGKTKVREVPAWFVTSYSFEAKATHDTYKATVTVLMDEYGGLFSENGMEMTTDGSNSFRDWNGKHIDPQSEILSGLRRMKKELGSS